jgi:hypothetical protein
MAGEKAQIRALVPFRVFGRTALVQLPVSGDPQEWALAKQNEARVIEVLKRRMYFEGEQYADENRSAADACGLNPDVERLPEHLRKHAYSTQIAEAVLYLADRLSDGWAIRSEDPAVQRVIDDMVAANDALSAEDEDGDVVMVCDDQLREAMVAQDVPVYVGWDPVVQVPVLDFWESEHVEVRMASTKLIDKVIRTDVVWRTDGVAAAALQCAGDAGDAGGVADHGAGDGDRGPVQQCAAERLPGGPVQQPRQPGGDGGRAGVGVGHGRADEQGRR